jgi:hypothetical protein
MLALKRYLVKYWADFKLFSSTFVHPAHFIDSLVIPRIIQVLPFIILFTLGFRKAASVAATAAAAELLRVMVVDVFFGGKSHLCARKRKRQTA